MGFQRSPVSKPKPPSPSHALAGEGMENTPIPPSFEEKCKNYLSSTCCESDNYKTLTPEDFKDPKAFFHRIANNERVALSSSHQEMLRDLMDKLKQYGSAQVFEAFRRGHDLEVASSIDEEFMMGLRFIVNSAEYSGSILEGCLFGMGMMWFIMEFNPDIFEREFGDRDDEEDDEEDNEDDDEEGMDEGMDEGRG